VAELLYRLGKLSARRPWLVIGAWIVILSIAVGGFLVGSKSLSSSFDIPGTASGKVIDDLVEKLPSFSGASGAVVFTTTNDSPLSTKQQSEISSLVSAAATLPGVAKVIDPFDAEQQRADQTQLIVDGRLQIAAGRGQIEAAETLLDSGIAQLDAAQERLDSEWAQSEAESGSTAELDAQQMQLDAQRAQLMERKATLKESSDELDAQSRELDQGAQLLALAHGIRTVSEDKSTAIVNVSFIDPRLELSEATTQGVMDYFEAEPIEDVEVAFSTDIAQGVPSPLGVGELIGVVLAAVLLVVMLGSILAAAFPIVTAIFGVTIAALGTLAFSGVVQMASVTPVLGLMLGLAVGIDYSLFIIYRHRQQLAQEVAVDESIGIANGTAGNAVMFAGTTVIIALLALNVTGVPFLGLMGTAGAIAVAIAVLIAITLTPALLGLAGMRVLGRRARTQMSSHPSGHPKKSTPVKPMTSRRAVVTSLVTVLVLLIVAIPALSMRVGLPDGSAEPEDSTAYHAYEVTEEVFGAGANSALLVTATLPKGLDDGEVLANQLLIAQTIAAQDDVVAVAPIVVSDDNTLSAFQVIPAEGPNSLSTDQLVRNLRDLGTIDGNITIGVAGQAAVNIDVSEALADVLPLYLLVVVGLSFLIMILVFRSLLVPLIATGGFILSLFATYGAVVAVFQWGWLAQLFGIHNPGPILSFLPVILVGILFGLAMDYQLFLATGMREAFVHGSSARLAVAQGFRAGRSVVIAAALIMVSVFSGFIASESVMIKSIGFGLACGVLVDAFLVRLLLMPAVMHLLGKSAWWIPRWLDNIMPNVDVEGAALERRHHFR